MIKNKEKNGKTIFISILIGLIISSVAYILKKNILISILTFISTIIIFSLYIYVKALLLKSSKIKKIEEVFPDFLQLMSSNLRAGMTIDRAMLLSSRKDFFPLDEEISRTGRDLATGKNIESALIDLSKRLGSAKIHKTILLIISGIKSGGNMATLLEETSISMKERNFIEKKASSNVLMYIIFIFFAIAVGAPILFSLSGILVEVMSNLLGEIPEVQNTQLNIPFTLSKINISLDFLLFFSIIFILTTDVLASLIIGLVSKGEEKQGLKFLFPLIATSLGIFFIIKFALSDFLGGLIGLQ